MGTINTVTSMEATRDARNHTHIEHAGDVGTQIQVGGAIDPDAGGDVIITADKPYTWDVTWPHAKPR